MTQKTINELAQSAATDIFSQLGPESCVVVMIGEPDGVDHSSYYVAWRGRCLLVEGLLHRAKAAVEKKLFPVETTS